MIIPVHPKNRPKILISKSKEKTIKELQESRKMLGDMFMPSEEYQECKKPRKIDINLGQFSRT